MNIITWSKLKTTPRAEIEAMMPLTVTFDGEPVGIFSKAGDVIVIGDMHPRVQMQLRAREQLARKGMPTPTVIT